MLGPGLGPVPELGLGPVPELELELDLDLGLNSIGELPKQQKVRKT